MCGATHRGFESPPLRIFSLSSIFRFPDRPAITVKPMGRIVSLEDAFAYYINRTYRMLRVDFIHITREAGHELTPEQYFVLNKLYHRPGQSQSDLSAELNDRANMKRGLDVLEKAGLVERRADDSDRRKNRVFLTDRGLQVVQSLNPAIEKARRRIYAGLNDKDMSAMRRILDIIETNLGREI